MVASYEHIHEYMKVCRSPKLALRNYGQFKIYKIEKNKKMPPWSQTGVLQVARPLLNPLYQLLNLKDLA